MLGLWNFKEKKAWDPSTVGQNWTQSKDGIPSL